MSEIPDRIGELNERHAAAEHYMRSENCSWDRAARLFRVPPYHELPPDEEAIQLPSADSAQLDRVLNYVRQGMPYGEAQRLAGSVE